MKRCTSILYSCSSPTTAVRDSQSYKVKSLLSFAELSSPSILMNESSVFRFYIMYFILSRYRFKSSVYNQKIRRFDRQQLS